MPKYQYFAKTQQGEDKSGIIEAKDTHHLSQMLRQEGLILFRAEKTGEKKKKFGFSLPFLKVSLTEKMFFAKNLQVMVAAGLSLPRALEILVVQAKNKKFKKALLNIKEEVSKGKSFSEALAFYPDIFPEIFQNMVKVGEESGTLEETLDGLALQMEKEQDLRAKIKNAMIYPIVIVSVMVGIGILMLVMVVPTLKKTFEELNVNLPLTTKVVIWLADFLILRWYLALILFFAIFFFIIFFRREKYGKKFFDFLFLKLPIVSSIIKKVNAAATARTLSSLITAGVPLQRSLLIVSNVLGNYYYKNVLSQAAEKVKKGEKLSDALSPYQDIYPLTLIQMISVGEETGETSKILAKLAGFFETETANATKNLTSVIEPALMLIIGAVVGFFAVSMIQPMYSMLGALQ